MRKVRIALLVFFVMLNIISLPVEAEEATYQVTNGITAVLSSDGVLTISGTGALPDYMIAPQAPWYMKRESIKKIIVGEEERVTDTCYQRQSNGNYSGYCGDLLSSVLAVLGESLKGRDSDGEQLHYDRCRDIR